MALQKDLYDVFGGARQMEEWSAKAYRRAIYATRRIARRFQELVIDGTRIDTGRAKANWHIGVDTIPTEVDEPPEEKWSAEVARGRALKQGIEATKTFKEGHQTLYIVNNVHYIELLEYGSSHNAPDAMLENAVNQIKSELQSAGWGANLEEEA